VVLTEDEVSIEGHVLNKEKLIAAYRELDPETTEEISDDGVLKLAIKDAEVEIRKRQELKASETVKVVDEKTEEYFKGINTADKKYVPEIKEILRKYSPQAILDPSFDFNDLMRWAKGGDVEARVKEAEERGYKRGIESIKPKTPVSAGGGSSGTKVVTLNESEKKRAREMFKAYEKEEDMYAEYADLKKSGHIK